MPGTSAGTPAHDRKRAPAGARAGRFAVSRTASVFAAVFCPSNAAVVNALDVLVAQLSADGFLRLEQVFELRRAESG